MDLTWKMSQTLIVSEGSMSEGKYDACVGRCCLCLAGGDFDYSKST